VKKKGNAISIKKKQRKSFAKSEYTRKTLAAEKEKGWDKT